MLEKLFGKIKQMMIIQLAINSILYSISLVGGFFLVRYFYLWREYPLFWGKSEIIFSALSFFCCFLFISIRFSERGKSLRTEFKPNFRNLTLAYMTFTSIMFFTSTFYEARFALIFGYLMSNVVLYLNLKYLLPLIEVVLSKPVEGSKRLIIKSKARKTQPSSVEYIHSADLKSVDRNKSDKTTVSSKAEIKVNPDRSSLVDDYLGERNMVKYSKINKTK